MELPELLVSGLLYANRWRAPEEIISTRRGGGCRSRRRIERQSLRRYSAVADQVECRVEGRPRRDASNARESAIVRLDLLGVIGTIAAVGLFVAGQRRGVEFPLGRRQ